MPQRKLFFFHLPKSGGTSMVRWLEGICGIENSQLLLGDDRQALQNALREGKTFLHGHCSLDLLADLPEEFFTFTLLREPVARVVSRYVHVMHSGEARLRAERESYRDFQDFLARPQARNGQCQLLAGRYRALRASPESEQLKEWAREGLQKLDWFAPTEALPEAAYALARHLHLPLRPFPRENRRRSDELWQSCLQENQTAIAAVNQADAALYRWARECYRRAFQMPWPARWRSHFQLLRQRLFR